MTDQTQIDHTLTGIVTVEPGTPYEAELFVESVITTFDAQEPPIIKIEQTEFYGVVRFADASLNRENGEAWQTVGCIDEGAAWTEAWDMYDDLTRAFTAVRLEEIAANVRRAIEKTQIATKPVVAAQEPPDSGVYTKALNIPQAVYDWYNARYDNQTYRAFRGALLNMLIESDESNELVGTLMNMLTDAALERSGAGYYAGMTAYLYDQLARYTCGGAQVFVAAEDYLRRFDRYIEAQPQLTVSLWHGEPVTLASTNGGKRDET